MAEILEDYDFRKQGRATNYPFDQWDDGQTWQVVEGVDFHTNTASFRMTLHKAAKRRGKKVKTAIPEEGVIVFRFYDPKPGGSPEAA